MCKKVYITRLQQFSKFSSIHVCIFYSYDILRRICTSYPSPLNMHNFNSSLLKYSSSNCPQCFPLLWNQMVIPLIDAKNVKMFTSQDFNKLPVISSIYVCVFYRHNISRGIVLSGVILVLTTSKCKTSSFLFSNTLSQIFHIVFLFLEPNDDSIGVLGYFCLLYFVHNNIMSCNAEFMSCLLESNGDS